MAYDLEIMMHIKLKILPGKHTLKQLLEYRDKICANVYMFGY